MNLSREFKNNCVNRRNAMASKPDASMPFLNLGKDQTEAMRSMQKELLDAYDQSSRAWLARVKSEGDLWSDLAKKLSETRSAPEALAAYQQCVAQRMQMAAEDGRRLYDDCQKITQTITRSLSNGRPMASTGDAPLAATRPRAAAQKSLAVMCPACSRSPDGLLALMESANRGLITRAGSMSQ